MSGEQGWRPVTDASDYFTNQQKALALAGRLPVTRRPGSLVGPGIAANAVEITDFNNLLALYDGFYGAAPGAVGAPNPDDTFVGMVVSDSVFGGWQQFKALETGVTYERTFVRRPLDPETISFGAWTSDAPTGDLNPIWYGASAEAASTTSGWRSFTVVPTVSATTDTGGDYFTPVAGGMQFDQPGLYSVDATAAFSIGVDGVRFGFGFFTTTGGDIIPNVAAGGDVLGGDIQVLGAASAPWISAHTTVRVLDPGAKVLMQTYVASATSRVLSVEHFVVARLSA